MLTTFKLKWLMTEWTFKYWTIGVRQLFVSMLMAQYTDYTEIKSQVVDRSKLDHIYIHIHDCVMSWRFRVWRNWAVIETLLSVSLYFTSLPSSYGFTLTAHLRAYKYLKCPICFFIFKSSSSFPFTYYRPFT